MSTSPDELPFFLAKNESFLTAKDSDDLLHPESFRNIAHDTATETQYFGFSIPEQRIHALCYLWHHPNLHVISGGAFVFQGVKRFTPEAELCDYRMFMSDAAIRGDLHEFRMDNGYGVKILEPLKRFHMTYRDEKRQNVIDLKFEAVQPAIMFGDGNHFEQTMEVKGALTLRGRQYQVDCFNIRDRSWGKPRPEALMSIPPTSWMTGAFDASFAFNCCVMDQSSSNPLLKDSLHMPDDKALNSGWVYRDGKLARIVEARKAVVRNEQSMVSESISLTFTDELARAFVLNGEILAACPFYSVAGKMSLIHLVKWQTSELTGYGDSQESFYPDYVHAFGTAG